MDWRVDRADWLDDAGVSSRHRMVVFPCRKLHMGQDRLDEKNVWHGRDVSGVYDSCSDRYFQMAAVKMWMTSG